MQSLTASPTPACKINTTTYMPERHASKADLTNTMCIVCHWNKKWMWKVRVGSLSNNSSKTQKLSVRAVVVGVVVVFLATIKQWLTQWATKVALTTTLPLATLKQSSGWRGCHLKIAIRTISPMQAYGKGPGSAHTLLLCQIHSWTVESNPSQASLSYLYSCSTFFVFVVTVLVLEPLAAKTSWWCFASVTLARLWQKSSRESHGPSHAVM